VFLVVWEHVPLFGHGEIVGVRITPEGDVLDPEPIDITSANKDQEAPAVASDGAGFLVVWEDEQGDDNSIRGARVTGDGVVLDPEAIIVGQTTHSARTPDVAWSDSSYLAVWEDHAAGRDVDLLAARVSTDGKVLDADPIQLSDAPGDQLEASVSSGNGQFFVVWQDGRDGADDIVGARVASDGSVLDPEGIRLVSSPGEQGRPDIAWDGSSHLMAWIDVRVDPAGDVMGVRVTSDGELIGEIFVVAASHQGEQRPAVSAMSRDAMVVVYDRPAPGPRFRTSRAFVRLIS
jgi:hypothetical protein